MTLSDEELVRTVSPAIRDHGWSFYFAPATLERGQELGLDPGGFYVMGRGGVLGDVEWQVVHSAFGYFNPEFIRAAWNTGREKVAPRDAGYAYTECCRRFGAEHFGDLQGLEAFCAAAEAVVSSAHPAGLSLFAGAAAEPLSDEPAQRAMQLLAVLREYRGSAHLVAVISNGLTPLEAHYLSRPEAMGLFGWSDGDTPAVTDEHRARLVAAEKATDRIVTAAYGVLDDPGRRALVGGLEAIAAAISG